MTGVEKANLVLILESMGIKEATVDFILGLAGKISTEETANRVLEALDKNRQGV
ncbi:MAG: hypothetical protein IJ679_05590 [Lachnospiraceae bacterium]|nr:hypothetical protein [Lachnospiraceae bacterium]